MPSPTPPPGARARHRPSRRALAEGAALQARADRRNTLILAATLVHMLGGEARIREDDFATLDTKARLVTDVDPETREVVVRLVRDKEAEA